MWAASHRMATDLDLGRRRRRSMPAILACVGTLPTQDPAETPCGRGDGWTRDSGRVRNASGVVGTRRDRDRDIGDGAERALGPELTWDRNWLGTGIGMGNRGW